MAKMIKFHPVTGECRCCGGNQFIFDEKEQTFVCEHCGTEVYSVNEEGDEPAKEETSKKEETINLDPSFAEACKYPMTSEGGSIYGVFVGLFFIIIHFPLFWILGNLDTESIGICGILIDIVMVMGIGITVSELFKIISRKNKSDSTQ